MPEVSTFHAACTLSLSRLNTLLAREAEINAPGNVTIQEIRLNGDKDFLYAHAQVTGPYNGGATLRFKPEYLGDTKAFAVRDVHVDLTDDSLFAKFAGGMIRNLFGDKLDEMITQLINTKFQTILDEMLQGLRNLSLPNGGILKFETQSWQLSNLTTSEEGLHFDVLLEGLAHLEF